MPRLPIDYSKTIMYKLCCLDQSINEIYIGQTTDFKNRKQKHKHGCCNKNSKEYNHKVYQFIRAHGCWDNWQMIQIEEYPCKNKREAEARETYLMKELKSTLNSKKSFQTEDEKKDKKKEYQKTDKMKEYQKSDKCKEYKKEYLKNDKMKEYKKEYQKSDKHREYHKKYQKQWYQTKMLYLNELKCYNLNL